MIKKYKKKYHVSTDKKIKNFAKTLLLGSLSSFALATVLTAYPLGALIINVVAPETSIQLSKILAKPVTVIADNSENDNPVDLEINDQYQLPEQDSALSVIPVITIKKIGVETRIIEQPLDNFEEALKLGVWRVPDFGTPLERNRPMILVAHRFGYVSWSQTFRETNSFYNLPKIEPGDKIEVIWDQRKFIYEVYQKEEGEDISHYGADLILYTCRFWNSPVRVFVYARLI